MIEMKDIGSAGGVLALIATLWKFAWERSDRADSHLAATIRSSEKVREAVGEVALSDKSAMQLASTIRSVREVRDAVGDVAVAKAEESGRFTDAKEQRLVNDQIKESMAEVKKVVKIGDRKLDALMIAMRVRRIDSADDDRD